MRRLLSILALTFLVTACAPKSRTPSDADPGDTTADAQPTPRQDGNAIAGPVATSTPSPQVETVKTPTRPVEALDENNPDWRGRFESLYGHYAGQFQPPAAGGTVEVEMANGQTRQGILESITDSQLVLKLSMGTITLTPESLSEQSRAIYFQRDFAKANAMNQLRAERAAWTDRQRRASLPTPTPMGYRDVAVVPPSRNPSAEPPRNQPPNGRVWQVEQYIRKNVAVPHSLRFVEWGTVHPHGDGYTVRCKYKVESAAGLGGINTEEMIFFMRGDGTVYNKAPWKGGKG